MNRVLATTGRAVRDLDLAATLDSGQVFRWWPSRGGWDGVVGRRRVWLRQEGEWLRAEASGDPGDWSWLWTYLGTDEDLAAIVATFPRDPLLEAATRTCRGLRLLRQDPWECLASFLMSSTKQIVQIRQILELLCTRHGDPLEDSVPGRGEPGRRAFPRPEVLATVPEAELRRCKMGFRARYLWETARVVADGALELGALPRVGLEVARRRLMDLPGVGRKIADCVLLFACGYRQVVPVDVWVSRALRELYFGGDRPSAARLLAFAETHFGPYGGYAQQYLFHYLRWRAGRVASVPAALAH